MAVSAALRAQVQALLPGERLEYVFPAVVPLGANVVIAVTPSAVVVLTTGAFGRDRPREVAARLPRRTPISEPDPYGIPSFVLDGIRYEVDDEYVAVVSALHRESAGDDLLPPDPLPDV
jgi:hypothetical protein